MNAHELRTSLEKAETQPEIVVRKVEKKLRQAENSQFELRPRFAKRTTLAGPLNRGGLGNSIFPPYQSLTSISQQKLNFLKWPSHTTIVDWSSAGVAQSGLDAAGSTPVRLEPSSLGMQNPVAICQDSVSYSVYFTAPRNRFSLNAFHNISDKVNFLFHLARPTHTGGPVELKASPARASTGAHTFSTRADNFTPVRQDSAIRNSLSPLVCFLAGPARTSVVKGPLPSLALNHPPLIPVKLCTFYALKVNCRTISLPATNKILCTFMHLSALIRKTC